MQVIMTKMKSFNKIFTQLIKILVVKLYLLFDKTTLHRWKLVINKLKTSIKCKAHLGKELVFVLL